MNPKTVSVLNNAVSQIITVKITKTDNKDFLTYFVLKLVSSNKANAYPISSFNNRIQYNYTTKTLSQKGSFASEQFKVHATLPKGAVSSSYTINATLYYDNTAIGSQQILTINVRK